MIDKLDFNKIFCSTKDNVKKMRRQAIGDNICKKMHPIKNCSPKYKNS